MNVRFPGFALPIFLLIGILAGVVVFFSQGSKPEPTVRSEKGVSKPLTPDSDNRSALLSDKHASQTDGPKLKPASDRITALAQTIDVTRNAVIEFKLTGKNLNSEEASFKITRLPAQGSLDKPDSQTGSFRYTTKRDFTGTDFFLFVVEQNGNTSEPAKVTIRVSAPVIWRFRTGGDILGAPATDDQGTLVFGSADKFVYAVNPDGSLKWKYFCEGYNSGLRSPWTAACQSHIHALSEDGTLKWDINAGTRILHTPVAGTDGTVYAATGKKASLH